MEDPKSRFYGRDSYGYDDTDILYHVNRENGREYKATVLPKILVKTVLQEMHDHFWTLWYRQNILPDQKTLLLA